MGDSKSTYNASPHEILDILGHNGGEGLDFDLLGEVVDSDKEKFCLPFARAEGINDAHSLEGE